MLVLRKEIKMGLGIGAAVLGIAGVYGLMALLSSSSGSQHAVPTDPLSVTSTDTGSSSHGLDSAVSGLPPKDDGATAKLPVPANDPFAESNRNDGSKADPWTTALATGKVNVPTVASIDKPDPILVKVPTDSSAAASHDEPLVTLEPTSGGTPKSSKVASNDNSQTSTPGGKYVIKSGDTFSTIAAREFGSKRYVAALLAANPNVDPRRLRPGMEISLPAKESASIRGSVEPAEGAIVSPIDTKRQYRVVAGDTLHRIAMKLYGKSGMWQDIYDANKEAIGPDAGKLKLGQLLNLPKPATR